MCPCQRLGRACPTCRSVGWEKMLSVALYIRMVLVEKFYDLQSDGAGHNSLHSARSPNDELPIHTDDDSLPLPYVDDGVERVQCVPNSISLV